MRLDELGRDACPSVVADAPTGRAPHPARPETLIPDPAHLCGRCHARPATVGELCAGCDEIEACIKADIEEGSE